MQQQPLDYQTSVPSSTRLTWLEKMGRALAALSAALPLFGLALAGSITWMTQDHSDTFRIVCFLFVSASCLCGLIALVGIPWWGHRAVWAPAIVGIAISLFLLIMSKDGGD